MSACTYRFKAGKIHNFFLLLFTVFHTSIIVNLCAQPKVDSTTTFQLQDIVITASRLKEDIFRSPVSVEKIDQAFINQSAAPSFFDALSNLKGVQMITPSMGFKVVNMRGFANTTNVRFVQLVDGMDNQAPHIGAPIANSLGPNDLDIESVEILPGVASALYGMNAVNGLANFVTKDPFSYRGLSVHQKIGINRVNSQFGKKPYSETSFRWASVVRSKVAIKLNGTFLRGTDWVANDQTDLNAKANASSGLSETDNPAFDPVNSYGNESPNRRTLSLGGKNYVVARTGYYEREVLDYTMQNLKGDATVTYVSPADVKLSYIYRFSTLDNVYQRSNRFRLDNYFLQQHGLSVEAASLQVRAYLNLEDTGESYNARSMAENMDKNFKSDNLWFSQYASAYNAAATSGAVPASAHQIARASADAGRPVPGSEPFTDLMDQLQDINNWDYGAALRVKSRMMHVEGQLNLTERLLAAVKGSTGIALLTGFDVRTYIIIPDGNYFINPEEPGKNILYNKYGGFLQATKTLWMEKVKVGVTFRADKNEYFSWKWNPRFTFVYAPVKKHNLRFSYQDGYRFPSVFEAFSNVNSGGVKRVGGLPVMSNGIFENSFKRASIDAFQSAVINDVNTTGLTKDEAILRNQMILVKNDYSSIKPEQIRSLEVGYRGHFLGGDLQMDVDFYYNRYSQFIAQVEMNIPKTNIADSIPFYLNDKNKQERYRLWTNSKTTAYNYGSSMSVKYRFLKDFQTTGNVTFANLQRKSGNDGLEDGFNTPQWIVNLSLGNDHVVGDLGFMITGRWQSNYYWQSFLVNGNVPSFHTIDAQINYQFDKIQLKIGGTNILNDYYESFLGGPSIGAFYYSTVTLHL